MMPDGLVYKNSGLNGEDVRINPRGETGAQDSIIPCADSVLDMPYPKNTLTEYLIDLRL